MKKTAIIFIAIMLFAAVFTGCTKNKGADKGGDDNNTAVTGNAAEEDGVYIIGGENETTDDGKVEEEGRENNTNTSNDFEYIVNSDNTVTITKYLGDSESVSIPEKINGQTVTSIGEQAFSFCKNLTNVTIPDSVTSIGSDAFYDTPFLDNNTEEFVIINGILIT